MVLVVEWLELSFYELWANLSGKDDMTDGIVDIYYVVEKSLGRPENAHFPNPIDGLIFDAFGCKIEPDMGVISNYTHLKHHLTQQNCTWPFEDCQHKLTLFRALLARKNMEMKCNVKER
jgi:hypothetical protein